MQKRNSAFDNISNRLAIIRTDIEQHQTINDFSFNIHAENFFRDVFNFIYDCNFENPNFKSSNAPCIDLVDRNKKLAYQITTTKTKDKIKKTLKALDMPEYENFEIRIFYLLEKAKLTNSSIEEIKNEFGINNISDNLFDSNDLIKDINDLETNRLIELSDRYFNEDNKYVNGSPKLLQIGSKIIFMPI
jgi:hypothetical protein